MNISITSLEELNSKNDYYVYEYFIQENNDVFLLWKRN